MKVGEEMVSRFLTWPLPASVLPDLCVMHTEYPDRIGTNLLTADEARQMLEHVLDSATTPGKGSMTVNPEIPQKPGYYWAKWRIPAKGTDDTALCGPSDEWEIVQVNTNSLDWERDPTESEALSVCVFGVNKTQWRDCFVWGDFVSPL